MNVRYYTLWPAALALCGLVVFTMAGCGGGGGGGGVVPRGSTVTGTVVDAATRAPVAGATVTVGTSNAVTDAAGDYTATNVPAGQQALSAAATGYLGFPAGGAPPFYVNVTAGTTALQDLLLVPASQPPPPPM